IYTDNKTGYDIQSPVKAGTYTITFDTTKFDMSNYAIAESGNEFSCTLTIKRRGLNVQVADRTVEVGDDDEYTADDLTCDFVEGDLENAGVAFNRTENATKPDGAVAEYSVTVSFTNDEVMDNYEIVTNKSGTLTIVHRWVIVKPEYVGENEFVYNGEPVGESNFDIDHKHKSDGAKGFDEEHLGMISKAYTFVNIENDRDIYTNGAFPVDAGTYEVSVVLTGKDGFVIGDNYYVEYETARFTIVKRKVTLATENDAANGGLTEFVYSNEEPDFKAVMTENTAGYGEDDGMIGGLPEATFKLYIDDAEAKSFNVGTYEVRASFDGEDNYEISWNPYTVKIVKRNLVFAPVNNYSQPQKYNGKDLTVGSEDYALLQDTELANGDKLYITATSLEPTKIMGSVTISSARVVNALDENDDKSGNYNLVYKYTAGDPLLAGLRRSTFSAMLEYEQFTVLYDQLADGGEYPFTGSSFKHKFDKNNAVEILDDEDYDGIYPAHTFSLTAGEVTVAADAGTYTDWLTTGRVFKVTDNKGRNVTALYSFVCNNATDENKPITVTKYVVEVTLNGVSADKLHVGEDGVLTAENGVNKLNAANYEVDGLISGHSAEIYAFDTDDGKLLAISLYGSLKSGAKYDVAVNYECTAVAPIDGVRIEYMTLEEIAELSKPAVNVAIDGEIVNAEALANGLGTLFTPSEIDGSWVLKSGVTVTGLLTDHFADVIVFNENGGYALGVVVYRVNASNRRIDVSANYKLKLPEQVGGVPVRQVGTDEIVDLKRDLVIDLSGFAYESDGKIADGSFTVSGLNTGDGHVAEVYVTATGGGSYEVTVLVFKYRKVGSKEQRTDRREVYEVKYVLPEGVELTVSTADVGTIYD
ncbi:MAG: hypothetical protein K2K39_02500, partial [Clostridia bacterium]|nr:hypothetical protein [Clostridia bacterium]